MDHLTSPCCGARLSLRATRAVCMACGAEGPLPSTGTKSFIPGVHDQTWKQGPPPVLLDEYRQMEAQTPQYASLTPVRP